MSDGPVRLTRRAALRGAAAAGAASLVSQSGAIAAPPATGRRVFSRWVGSLSGQSGQLSAPAQFSLVGVEWDAPSRAAIELRTRRGDGDWSRWALASVLGHGPDRPAAGPGLFGEPIWTGPADYVQLRSAGAVQGVRLHFVAATAVAAAAVPEARAAQATALAQPVLDAGPGQPSIIAREAWARGQAPPRHVPEYATIKLAFVHHSETPNGYAPGDVPSILLSIFGYHVYVRGFWDIAYNFAIDAFGGIWEARAGGIDEPVVGAHAGGYNAQSTGIVVLGSFMDVVPPPAAINALEHVLAWKLSLHGLPVLGRVTVVVDPSGAIYTPFGPGAHVSLPRVAGHRDGDSTDCPGNAFYARLPSIRPRVAALVGTPARVTLTAPSAPVNAGATVVLSGRLADLSGGALVGEPIELQQVGSMGATTFSTVRTDDSGGWSLTLAFNSNALVRALHRPAPAAVSDPAQIEVAPVLTLTLDSVSPLVVSGTVSPAGPRATIDLYRRSPTGQHLAATKRVRAAGGSFQARIKPPRPGNYVLVARTVANARYAAGASPPLEVTIP